MVRKILWLAAASVVLGSCGSDRTTSPETEQTLREWRVDPGKVDPGALKESVSDGDVRRFYQASGWAPVWTQDKANALLRTLGEAPRHALEQSMFLPASAPGDPAQVEAALTAAAIGYARALAKGRIDPARLGRIYTVPRPRTDVVAGLRAALAGEKLNPWFATLPPQTPEYRAMSDAFVRYVRQAQSGGGTAIGAGEPINIGDKDIRVVALAEALRSNGYLPEEEEAERSDRPDGQEPQPQPYTRVMSEAVKRMQSDYGIKADGIVGEDTLEVLNTSPAARARQLAVNMERLRWLDRNPPATRIDVNTAAAYLDYWRDGHHRDRRRVVVGQPEWETPQLGSPIFQLVANPTWTVPESIEEDELADKGPAYFAANNMIRKNGRIVQLPGPKNSLGLVKFDMHNDEAIYLHDTPHKQFFQESQRQRSHGCVRVEDAIGFARMVAGDDGILADFDEAMMSGDESFVKLKKEIPVRLLYHTVFVDDSGRVRFRADAYGWDEDLAVALGLAHRARRTLRSKHGDVGP